MTVVNGIGYKMNKAKETATQFTVIGRGEFPMDMLRYDGCYPKSEKDTVTMQSDGLREVMLHKTLNWGHSKIWSPTVGRWNSFGWAVLGDLPDYERGLVRESYDLRAYKAGDDEPRRDGRRDGHTLTHNAKLITRLRTPMVKSRVGVSSRHPFVAEARDGGLRPVADGADTAGLRPDPSHGFP